MPEYEITADPEGLTIQVKGVGGQQAEMLSAFKECPEGNCTCPTDEYEKVSGMQIAATDDEIQVRLRSKPGTAFDTNEISACLDYTTSRGDATDL